jgi:hypothetical protein
MKAAQARGKRMGRPATLVRFVKQIERLAETTDLSVRKIQEVLRGKVSRAVVGEIVKRIRNPSMAGN